jgi:hypothetical protein
MIATRPPTVPICDGCRGDAVIQLVADRGEPGRPHKAWLAFCRDCLHRAINELERVAIVPRPPLPKIQADPAVPPGEIQFRAKDGEVLGRIVGLAPEPGK